MGSIEDLLLCPDKLFRVHQTSTWPLIKKEGWHEYAIFLSGLAAFDSLVVISVVLLKGIPSVVETSYQTDLLLYLYPLMNISWMTSIYLTVLLSLERYVGICHRIERFCTTKKTMVYMLTIVILSGMDYSINGL